MLLALQDGLHTMARKLRLQYPGAIYHVMNRGDRREAIFTDDEDRRLFLDGALTGGNRGNGEEGRCFLRDLLFIAY